MNNPKSQEPRAIDKEAVIKEITCLVDYKIIDIEKANEIIEKFQYSQDAEEIKNRIEKTENVLLNRSKASNIIKNSISSLENRRFIDSVDREKFLKKENFLFNKYKPREDLLEIMHDLGLDDEMQNPIKDFLKNTQKLQEDNIDLSQIVTSIAYSCHDLYKIAGSMAKKGINKNFWSSITDTLECSERMARFGVNITASNPKESELLNSVGKALDTAASNQRYGAQYLGENAKAFIKLCAAMALLVKDVTEQMLRNAPSKLYNATLIEITKRMNDFVKNINKTPDIQKDKSQNREQVRVR